MENLTELLDDMSQLEYNEEEQKRLEEKFKPKTQVEVNEPFFKGAAIARRIIQCMSVISGLGVSLYFGDKFPSLFWPIVLFTGFILVLIEVAIEMSLDKHNSIRIQNKSRTVKINAKIYALALLPLMACSGSASFVGWPVVVEQLSKHEPLAILDSVRAEFKAAMAANEFKFAAQKKDIEAQITDIDTSMRWHGIIIEEAQETYAKLQEKATEKDDLMNAANEVIEFQMKEAEMRALKDNQHILKDHKDFCSHFGWFAAGLSVLLYGLLVVLSFFMSNHENAKRKENNNKKELLKKNQDSVKQVVKEKTFQEPPIDYILSDGTVKKETIGKFINYFKSSGPDRKAAIKTFFDTYYEANYHEGSDTFKEKLDRYKDIVNI